MKTWSNYKEYIKVIGPEERQNMETIEEVSEIIATMILRREELGISQRELAKKCGLKQSAIARMETLKTTPQIDTIARVLKPLGMKLAVVPDNKPEV